MAGFRFEERGTSTQGPTDDLLHQSFADIHLEPTKPLHETLQVFRLHESHYKPYKASTSHELSLIGPKFVEEAQEQPHSPSPPLVSAHSPSPHALSMSQHSSSTQRHPNQRPTPTAQTVSLLRLPLEPLIPKELHHSPLNTSPSSPNHRPKK